MVSRLRRGGGGRESACRVGIASLEMGAVLIEP